MSEPRPYRVLVVCTGNTCRTPMAVALLRELFERAGVEADVRSAGTHAMEGVFAHPEARAVAAEAGLDLSGHRSRPLTADLVRWADVVLGMSPGHVSRTRALDETAEVHVITEFDPAGGHDVGVLDPIGCERAVYEAVFDQIRSCLETFVDRRFRPSPMEAGRPPEAG